MTIDVHCHVFNAQDLAPRGFLKHVMLENFDVPNLGALMPIIDVLCAEVQAVAPNFGEESAVLDSLVGVDGRTRSRRIDDAEKESRRRFTEALIDERRTDLTARLLRFPVRSIVTEVEKLFDGGLPNIAPVRFLRALYAMSRYRFLNVLEFQRLYPGVHLLIPALVDMDRGVRGAAPTALPQQVRLMEKIIRLLPGRVHAFAAFDPWHQAEMEEIYPAGHPAMPIAIVKDAIESRGFVGVKLYPQMGFLPLGNGGISRVPDGRAVSPKFGERTDAALREMYAWCETAGVPIMAHGNATNYAHAEDRRLRELGGPEQWRLVLREFPDLHVNIGHFGGIEGFLWKTKPGWLRGIVALMRDHPHVYADMAYFAGVRDPETREKLCAAVRTLRDDSDVIALRMMYGSDWLMLAKEADHEHYLTNFRKVYDEALAEGFFGKNARAYLGLVKDAPTWNRLRTFYGGAPEPAWLR